MMKKVILFALFLNAFLLVGRLWQEHRAAAQVAPCAPGDMNGDGEADVSDAVHLLLWLFSGGSEPVACAAGNDLTEQETAVIRRFLGHLKFDRDGTLVIQSRDGIGIVSDREVAIVGKSAATLSGSSAAVRSSGDLTIEASGEEGAVRIASAGTGGVTLESTSDVEGGVSVSSTAGAVDISAPDGGVSVSSATGALQLSGFNVDLSAEFEMDVSALQRIDVSATGRIDIESATSATLSSAGSEVSAAGAGVRVQAPLIHLN